MYIAIKGRKTAHLTTKEQADLYRKNGWEVSSEKNSDPYGVGETGVNPDEQMGYEPMPRSRTR